MVLKTVLKPIPKTQYFDKTVQKIESFKDYQTSSPTNSLAEQGIPTAISQSVNTNHVTGIKQLSDN